MNANADSTVLLVFAFLPLAVLLIQIYFKPTLASLIALVSTFAALFLSQSLTSIQSVILFSQIVCMWCSLLMVYFAQERSKMQSHNQLIFSDEISKQAKLLNQEIGFYEEKKRQLVKRAAQRRQLVDVARALGSSLDPAEIQQHLLSGAQTLFPGQPIEISLGQSPNPVDSFVIQKAQPILVPNNSFKGHPLMAAPIVAQGAVAGVLRIGGRPGPEFSRDDLRLLEMVTSFASMSLENTVLFQQVQDSALRDNLTGLITHRAFGDYLESAILEAARYNQPLSVILADVDHFKSVNDTHGHQAGDQILQGLAHVMVRNVRDVDVVSRYGGEEFIVLLLNTPHRAAVEVAERMRSDLESQEFAVGHKRLGVTASFGVASFPQDAASGQQLVRTADQRLYAAKAAGRNIVLGKAA